VIVFVHAALTVLVAQSAAPGRLTDLDGSYCLETGYCRAVEDGYRTPPGGALFAATALLGFGVIQLARRRR
jgi:hypothetical protein